MCVCVNQQYLTARNLLVDDCPILTAAGATHARRLCTTKPLAVGDIVCGYWGDYRSRLPKDKDGVKLDTIKIAEVPGICHLPICFMFRAAFCLLVYDYYTHRIHVLFLVFVVSQDMVLDS